jgi:probable rRNA maturation factor
MNKNSASQLPAVADDGSAASDDPDPSPLTILVSDEAWRALGDIEAAAARAASAAAAKIPLAAGREAALMLSCDAEVRKLNAEFRGQDKPTNVLSFPASPLPGFPADEAPLGDIVIARETVLREAAEEGKRPLDHLAHLTVHGLLHLAGFDHETAEEASAMEALERDILASIGIADPYQTPYEERPSPGRGQPA